MRILASQLHLYAMSSSWPVAWSKLQKKLIKLQRKVLNSSVVIKNFAAGKPYCHREVHIKEFISNISKTRPILITSSNIFIHVFRLLTRSSSAGYHYCGRTGGWKKTAFLSEKLLEWESIDGRMNDATVYSDDIPEEFQTYKSEWPFLVYVCKNLQF